MLRAEQLVGKYGGPDDGVLRDVDLSTRCEKGAIIGPADAVKSLFEAIYGLATNGTLHSFENPESMVMCEIRILENTSEGYRKDISWPGCSDTVSVFVDGLLKD